MANPSKSAHSSTCTARRDAGPVIHLKSASWVCTSWASWEKLGADDFYPGYAHTFTEIGREPRLAARVCGQLPIVFHSFPGMMRFMNSSKRGTVNAVSP